MNEPTAPCPTRHQDRANVSWGLLVLMAFGALSIGCATFPEYGGEVGVRGEIESLDLTRVAVLPFAAEDPFGYSPEELDAVVKIYEDTAVADLSALGMTVVTPASVRERLRGQEREDELRTRLELNRSLDQLFEDDGRTAGTIEDERTAFVRELAAELDVDLVLVGQVVYHSSGECSGQSTSLYTPYVVFEGGEAPGVGRVPCATSHFHAKLIDAARGRTVWYNRALREVRANGASSPTPDLAANAREVVHLVIAKSEASLKSTLVTR